MGTKSIPCAGPCRHLECSAARRKAMAEIETQTAAPEPVVAPRSGVKLVLNARSSGRGPGRMFTKTTGREAGLRGGTVRSQRLAPEQRQDIARRAASARWGGKQKAGA